ncbi:MAG TPA: hypothetical protein VGK20_10940 [Candidatus Binatia bacterium]|jgi:hypothetical protein
MSQDGRGVRARRTLTLVGICSLVAATALAASAGSPPTPESPSVAALPHDQYGVIPGGAVDSDLVLPDPVLDRNWDPPKPGEPGSEPAKLTKDEDELDPFKDSAAPPPPVDGAAGDDPASLTPEQLQARLDAMQNHGAAQPSAAGQGIHQDVVDPPSPDAGLERSPLDEDDAKFRKEEKDGDW